MVACVYVIRSGRRSQSEQRPPVEADPPSVTPSARPATPLLEEPPALPMLLRTWGCRPQLERADTIIRRTRKDEDGSHTQCSYSRMLVAGLLCGGLLRGEDEVGRIAIQRHPDGSFGNGRMARKALHPQRPIGSGGSPDQGFGGLGALAELALLLDPDVADIVPDLRRNITIMAIHGRAAGDLAEMNHRQAEQKREPDASQIELPAGNLRRVRQEAVWHQRDCGSRPRRRESRFTDRRRGGG